MLLRLSGQRTGLFIHGQGQGFVFFLLFGDQIIELLAGIQIDVGFLQIVFELFDLHLQLALVGTGIFWRNKGTGLEA